MNELLTWLNDVLDQVEATAQAWDSEQRSWRTAGGRQLTFDNGSREKVAAIDVQASGPNQWDRIWVLRDHAGLAQHIAMHDPAAVLADITAKRAILAEHSPWPWEREYRLKQETVHGVACSSCGDASDERYEPWPCNTVRLLASAYNTWPGYREEWAPEGTR